jgi:hypothetical protein
MLIPRALPVTSRTARHHFLASYSVFLLKIDPLVRRQISILPLHVEDLGFRADILLRLAVASEAPFHLERIFLVNGWHIVDLPMTGRAADAFRYVNTVIEVRKLWKIVDALPLDRFVFTETCTDRFEIRTIRPDLAVTIHTGLRRRHSGRSRRFYRRVAVTAIDSIVTNVVLVAELNRLLFLQVTSC